MKFYGIYISVGRNIHPEVVPMPNFANKLNIHLLVDLTSLFCSPVCFPL